MVTSMATEMGIPLSQTPLKTTIILLIEMILIVTGLLSDNIAFECEILSENTYEFEFKFENKCGDLFDGSYCPTPYSRIVPHTTAFDFAYLFGVNNNGNGIVYQINNEMNHGM